MPLDFRKKDDDEFGGAVINQGVVKNFSKPKDELQQLRDERNQLQKQMLRRSGTTDEKGNYTIKSIIDAMTGKNRKKLEKDEEYQKSKERLNEINTILQQRFNESSKSKTLPMQAVSGIEKNVIQPINTTTNEIVRDPSQTSKTLAVGLEQGFTGALNSIENSGLDLLNAVTGNKIGKSAWFQQQKAKQLLRQAGDPFRLTDTYRKAQRGELDTGQNVAYNVASNIGAMGPSIGVSLATGSPTAGSAVFYAQSQDNYYNEAKKRGYGEKQARMYSLSMAGVETLVERLGFDEIGGLGEGSIVRAMLGEGAEEFVTPYIDTVLRKYGFKENVSWKDTNKEAVSGALMGALTGGIMQLAGKGFSNVDVLTNKVNNNQKITSTDIQNAIQEVEQADPNFVDTILSEASENIDKNTIEETKKQLERTATNTTEQQSKQISNENRDFESLEKTTPSEEQKGTVTSISPSKESKTKEKTINIIDNELGLSRNEKQELNSKLKEYESKTKEELMSKKTQDEIKNIISDYKTRTETIENTDVKEIKNYIRNTKIKISDNLKNQISDYGSLRKSNFGNLKLGDDGTPIDSFWVELTERYPQFSSESVNGEADILNALVDFVQQDNNFTEQYDIPEEDIDKLTTKVFNNLIKNAKTESKMPQYAKEEKGYPTYDIPMFKNSQETVEELTKNSNSKQKQLTQKILSEPQKNKVTTVLPDGTTYINPSENKQASLDEITKMIDDTTTTKDVNEVKVIDKGRRNSLIKMKDEYLAKGNKEMADIIQYYIDNDLYDIKHVTLDQAQQQRIMLEDVEDYYKKFMNKYEEAKLKGLPQKLVDELQDEAVVLKQHYNIPKHYNPGILSKISVIFADIGTPTGQIMNARRGFYGDNLDSIADKVIRDKHSLFVEESKNHLDDPAWLKKNNPINPNSPYYITPQEYSKINKLGQELLKIEDTNSKEYIKKSAQLDKEIKKTYGTKTITGKLKSLSLTNILASTRIWTQNIKGNFVNLAQYEILDNIPGVIADKVMSTQTDIRTKAISFQGDVVEGTKAFAKGVYDSFYEFKNDVSLDKFKNKFDGEIGKKGVGTTFSDENPVGWALNRYEKLVSFALDLGDRPYAMYYFEKSCYNQRMVNAQLEAQKQNTNMIYKETFNDKTKMHSVFYYDSEGRVHTGELMTDKEYKDFAKTAKTQELTEDMVDIAEKEALENTYQNDNAVVRAAVGLKEAFNVVHFGDIGLGDVFLKFTKTGSNMAKALYEHSPLEAIQLTKDIIRYNENLKNKSVTPQMQHKVASDFGKLVGGATVYGAIGLLKWGGFGNITKKDDDDKQSKYKNVSLGSQEYSFKLGNTDYTFKISNDSTLESLIRTGVDIRTLIKDTGSLFDTFLGTADSFVNNMIDASFMSSVLEMGNTYKNPIDNIAKKISAQPSTLIPSFVKDFSYKADAYTKRNVYDKNVFQYMLNQIIDKTPFRKTGLKIGKFEIEGLTPKRNSWGEVQKVGADMLSSAWNTWLLGDSLSKINDDPIANETMKVYIGTNDTNALPKLNMTNDSFKYNEKEIKLNNKDKDEYMRVYGKTAYDSIKKLMETSQYKNGDDEYKLALLKQAYSYATEKAKENKLKSINKPYYNFNKKDNKYTEYKKPVFEEIIEHDISIKEAQYKRKYNNSYKLKTSITNWDTYNEIASNIKSIKKMYSKENGFGYKKQRYAVKNYINKLGYLTAVQKAMIIKKEFSQSEYSNYDNAILKYMKTLPLTKEEYQYMYKQLGLGGYWRMYYVDK